MRRAGVLMIALSLAGAAHASDWKKTFSPDAVGSYLPAAPVRIQVAPAGGGDDAQLRDAARELAQAFRQSSRAQQVLEVAPAPAGVDDRGLVKKNATAPVNAVAVLRLVPGSTGRAAMAIVSIYDVAGAPLGSFSAEEGVPMRARAANHGPGTAAVWRPTQTARVEGASRQGVFRFKGHSNPDGEAAKAGAGWEERTDATKAAPEKW